MNSRKMFVGNLSYSVREGQLKELFSRFGEVVSVRVLEKRGYGFVEMATQEQANSARTALSETEFEGRNLLIDGVRPPKKAKKPFGKPGSGSSAPRTSRPAGSGTKSGYGYRGKNPRPTGTGSGRSSRNPSSGRSSAPSRRNTGAPQRRR